jgi:hypothetical protein
MLFPPDIAIVFVRLTNGSWVSALIDLGTEAVTLPGG